mgnify:FL=1
MILLTGYEIGRVLSRIMSVNLKNKDLLIEGRTGDFINIVDGTWSPVPRTI